MGFNDAPKPVVSRAKIAGLQQTVDALHRSVELGGNHVLRMERVIKGNLETSTGARAASSSSFLHPQRTQEAAHRRILVPQMPVEELDHHGISFLRLGHS